MADVRKNLRRDIENQNYQLCISFLDKFSVVKTRLDVIGSQIEGKFLAQT